MQRYFAKGKNDNLFVLEESDIHHICNVMRMRDGDFIEVVYDGILYKCKVSISDNVNVYFDSILDNHVVSNREIVLIIPVLKEQKMDLVLQKSTELAVDRIIPIVTERCVVKVDAKEEKKINRWNRIVKEASEQCKRISIPVIDNIRNIDDLNYSDGVKFVCSTREFSKNIKNVMHNILECAKMYIVVGPEGGLSIKEEDKLNDMGFVSISLGNRILRVETVPICLLSILNYEMLE